MAKTVIVAKIAHIITINRDIGILKRVFICSVFHFAGFSRSFRRLFAGFPIDKPHKKNGLPQGIARYNDFFASLQRISKTFYKEFFISSKGLYAIAKPHGLHHAAHTAHATHIGHATAAAAARSRCGFISDHHFRSDQQTSDRGRVF